jgi:hypothetical protein
LRGEFFCKITYDEFNEVQKELIMDKTTKTLLIIIGGILVLCACAVAAVFATGLWSFGRFVNFAERSVSESPQVAVRVGGEIADFDIPEGFGAPYSVHFGGVTVINYQSESGRSHLVLAQFPPGTSINVDEMLEQIQEGSNDPNSIWYDTNADLVEQIPVTIRGQETMLNISEGTSSDGVDYRSATATFQGRGGPALVMVAGPLSEWDQEMVEEFISFIQ